MASYGHSCSQQAPQGHTSMASYGHSCSQQAPQGHTSMASYGRPSLPFASPKTLQTLQTLKTLKTLQTNPSCSHQATSIASAVCQPWNPPNFTLQPTATHPAANRFFWPLLLLHPTATPRPHINGFLWASKATHQWLLMGIQVCRFILQPTATPRHTSMASCGHSCSQQAPQGHTSMASYGRPCLPFASPTNAPNA